MPKVDAATNLDKNLEDLLSVDIAAWDTPNDDSVNKALEAGISGTRTMRYITVLRNVMTTYRHKGTATGYRIAASLGREYLDRLNTRSPAFKERAAENHYVYWIIEDTINSFFNVVLKLPHNTEVEVPNNTVVAKAYLDAANVISKYSALIGKNNKGMRKEMARNYIEIAKNLPIIQKDKKDIAGIIQSADKAYTTAFA